MEVETLGLRIMLELLIPSAVMMIGALKAKLCSGTNGTLEQSSRVKTGEKYALKATGQCSSETGVCFALCIAMCLVELLGQITCQNLLGLLLISEGKS